MMYLQKFIVLISIIVTSTIVLAQNKDTLVYKPLAETKDYSNHLIFTVGTAYQKEILGSAGVIFGNSWSEGRHIPGGGVIGLLVSTEFNFSRSDFHYAPKIGFHFEAMDVAFRFGLAVYSDKKTQDIKLTPEIGYSHSGRFNIMIGYNIPLTTPTIQNVGNVRLSINMNIDKNLNNIF